VLDFPAPVGPARRAQPHGRSRWESEDRELNGEPVRRGSASAILNDHQAYVEAMIADPLALKPAFDRGRP
jgi:hypothetical protein